MQSQVIPFYTGILSVLGLFLISFFLAVGLRAVYSALKVLLKKPKPKRLRAKKQPRPPIKSIEIDPDEIDRIYVKRS